MTNVQKLTTVIVPSYNPDEKLRLVVEGLTEYGFKDIIIIDDGSAEQYKKNFPTCDEFPEITLLVHEVNRGKGAALKTAFSYFIKNRPDMEGVVCVDGDNQHRVEDVYACCERMFADNERCLVLGCRDFTLPDVPMRSRFGNRFTSGVFAFFCGIKVSDTQTGLRAVPREFLTDLIKIEGDRYEYETNMLLQMKTLGISFSEIKIKTVYIDDNQTSHFRPFFDSMRIYGLILKFMAASVASFVVDNALFFIFELILSGKITGSAYISAALARIISSGLNYTLNRKKVFKKKSSGLSLLRYYILAVLIYAVSSIITNTIKTLLSSVPIITTLVKIVIDTVLFAVSFRVQREWVFKNNTEKNK